MMRASKSSLVAAVGKVVERGNCSGCGLCAALSPSLSMAYDEAGFLRPVETGVNDPDIRAASPVFFRSCPGVVVDARAARAPQASRALGRFHGAYEAASADEATRQAASSAGVVSTLIADALRHGRSVVAASGSTSDPLKSEAILRGPGESHELFAGSRYAPVAVAGRLKDVGPEDVFVGKPCEVAALRASYRDAPDQAPLLVSFFCAGTPSQNATRRLVEVELGMRPDRVTSLKYRGAGWPGRFEVTEGEDETRSLSYKESWGRVLGKELQWRCKICPDGTGQMADIVVGDYWEADERGFPVFHEGDLGRSVAISRTVRGEVLLKRLAAEGAVVLDGLDIRAVERVQPFQVERRLTMTGRLAGAALGGRRPPVFRGFGFGRGLLCRPVRNARALVGTCLRARKLWK